MPVLFRFRTVQAVSRTRTCLSVTMRTDSRRRYDECHGLHTPALGTWRSVRPQGIFYNRTLSCTGPRPAGNEALTVQIDCRAAPGLRCGRLRPARMVAGRYRHFDFCRFNLLPVADGQFSSFFARSCRGTSLFCLRLPPCTSAIP